MDRLAKRVTLGASALALAIFGAMLAIDALTPPPKNKAELSDSVPPSPDASAGSHAQGASQARPVSQSAAEVPGGSNAVAAPDGVPPATASLQSEALRERAERRRAARALLEEFRKPSKAAPDWETTSRQALFLPDGRPVDPYMLPPLQLPASMAVNVAGIELDTDIQVSEWERLQDEFVKEVGDSVPTDAASRKTWIRAQRKNDDKFRAKFGTEAFLRQQMEAYRAGFLQE